MSSGTYRQDKIMIPSFVAQHRDTILEAIKNYFLEYVPLPDKESTIRYQYICFQYSSDIIKTLVKDRLNIDVCISEMGSGTSFIRSIWHARNDPLWHGYEIECLFADNHIPYVIVGANGRGYDFRQFNYGIKDDVFAGDFFRPDLKLALRSSWEANIARIFNLLKIPFKYECKSFPLRAENEDENEYYLPDFMWDNNVVEVKGFWDIESRQKAKQFMELYPQYHYYMIDADMYMSLQSKYSHLIPAWEYAAAGFPMHMSLQIVGINYGNRSKTVSSLVKGQHLVFHRDWSNRYDRNAILVSTDDGNEIGYVSSDWACIFAPKIDLGMEYLVSVTNVFSNKVEADVVRSNSDIQILHKFFF